jgi:TonB family protein
MREEDAQREASVSNQDELRSELGLSVWQGFYDFVHSHRWTWASFAVHGIMLACLALLPPRGSALALDMLSEDARYARYLATALEQTTSDVQSITELLQGEPSGGAAQPGDQGKAGKPAADARPKRSSGSVAEPAKSAPTEARSVGILGVLAAHSTWLDARGKFEQGAGFGYEPGEALGSLLGAQLGDSSGFGALGMRGTGRAGAGGVAGSIGVGRLVTGDATGPGGHGRAHELMPMGRRSHVPRVISSGAEVRGSLSKESIRRVIQRHLNEVRFCYEEALRRRPELAGRVQTAFLIAPSGAVQQASIAESSLNSPEVEDCIVRAVRRWPFPAPEGGGYVTVRYPFLLEQAP